MNIFSRALHMIEGVAHSAQSILVKIFGQDAVTKMEEDVSAIFKQDVLQIFTDGITAVESLQVDNVPATGDQKRAAAFQHILADLKTSGVNLADHTINLGIELVVSLLKSKSAVISGGASLPQNNPTPAPVSS